MQNKIPADMMEVGQKLKWEQDLGMSATESSVIQEAILDCVQYFLDEALEGSYWTASWVDDAHSGVKVIDAGGQNAGVIKPQQTDFESEFRANSNNLIFYIDQQVTAIVKAN